MTFVDEYLADALDVSGIAAERLGLAESLAIHHMVATKYSRGPGRCLWERLFDTVSLCREDAWRLPSKFIREDGCLLFFDSHESTSAYRFNSGRDLAAMFEAAPGFVFYLTDDEATYVFAFNDHDYLIACGTAKSRVEEYLGQTRRPT